MSERTLSAEERYRATRNNTLMGAAANLFLAALAIVVGFTQHSQALIADGIHSLSDLVGDIFVLLAAKHSQKKADSEHPYGHGRIETLASVVLGSILIFVGAGIIVNGIDRIQDPSLIQQPTIWAFVVAVASILAKEGLYQYTIRLARRIKSSVVHANAWHHRSDAFSTFIASIGILGAFFGVTLLDAIAAIVVSILIAKIGWKIAANGLRELIDTGFDSEKLTNIKSAILATSGVRSIHSLRTRSHGGQGFVDVHLIVEDPKISVSEGHRIGESVYQKLTSGFDFVSDVVVHVDHEDDETAAPSSDLPLRHELLQRLNTQWKNIPYYSKIRRVTLHYINGKIHVELLLPIDVLNESAKADIVDAFRSAIADCADIDNLMVFFE